MTEPHTMPRTTKKTIAPIEKHTIPTVPVAEQPYQVPENWRWVRVSDVSDIITGGTPSKKHSEYYGGSFPFYKPSDLDAGRNVYEASEYLSQKGKEVSRVISAQSTMVCCIGSIGKSGFLLREGTTNQQINSSIPKYNPLYLYYYFQTETFVNELKSKASATTISIVNKSKMEQCCFPLPPLAEQQRIVDRIESLFAKLDEAREKAQAVVDGFENRKAAILHKAFTGELTKKWREERGIGITNWQKYTIQELCDKITCGKTPKEHITAIGDIPFLKVYNIVNNKIEFESASQFIPETIHKNKLSSSILRPNDVIMNIVGPPLRKVAIIPNRYPEWNMNQAIVRFRPNNKLNYKFLYYFLINPETLDKIIPETRGVVGQVNISVSQSRNLIIMLPKLIEQIEIVKSLDTIFSQEQRARDLAESVIAQIDGMKKAILARAFRGELGTNVPGEAVCEVP